MHIEIWSDVVCPWCEIGRARLDRALTTLPETEANDIDITWRSFELDQNRPATTDVPYVDMLARKYRTSTDQAQAMIDRMTAAGAEDGIEFRFDRARPGNTFDAHRLIHLGKHHGMQHAAKHRFLAAYHTEGEPIADHATLTRLAVDAGLDEDEIADVLASDRFAADVRADEQEAFDLGVNGVPFFVFDRAVGLSGAQPPEVIVEAMTEARRRTSHAATTSPRRSDESADDTRHDHAPGEQCVDGMCHV